jgi:RecB family exonuclease
VALKLIVGPPNAGRAGRITDGIKAVLERDPVLVVPTADDTDRFEGELAGKNAAFGTTIVQFDGLFREVAAATGAASAQPLTDSQQLGAVRAAIAGASLGPLRESAARPGFAPAAADLVGEIGAATLDPATVTANAAEDGDRYVADLAAINAAYAELVARSGHADSHGLARAATDALRADPGAWGARPVFLYGFDDLSIEQLELVQALAGATDVSATVTYEDRAAYSARATLQQELIERGGEVAEVLEADPEYTRSSLLFHIERSFLVPDSEPAPAEAGEGLTVFEAAGSRGQAEQIAEQVRALLEGGTPAEKIAVALRNVDRDGPLYDSIFESLGIPAATHARVPLAATATGRALLLALRVARGGASAADLVAYLRCPGRSHPEQVDWLERAIRRGRIRTAEAALEEWKGRDLFELDELREQHGPALLRKAASLASTFAEYPDRRAAAKPGPRRRLELRAGATAARALAELAELGLPGDAAAEAAATLQELSLPLWQGSATGRVTISTPYRLRAGRFRHVFVAPLQLGEFPRPGRADAMLGDEQRAALGLPKRVEAEAEERYLFAVCLSLPTDHLYLCWQSSDEDGAATVPSPFLDEVRILLDPAPPAEPGDPDELLESLTVRRDLAVPSLAPFEPAQLVARAEAAAGRVGLPGPLKAPAVLAELEARHLYGASTLEEFRTCSYRWFVGHELRPQALDPKSDALSMGSTVHKALEGLYGAPPVLEPRPTAANLEVWRERAAQLVTEAAQEFGLGGDDPGSIAVRMRAEQQVAYFLARDAEAETPLVPVAEMVEASFGDEEGDMQPPLELDGFALRGKIDRVDVAETGTGRRALLRDYKTSREVTTANNLVKDGKLQLQLYSIAVERLWGIEPAGAIYEPLGATETHRPRGILKKEEADLFGGLGVYRNDQLEPEDFEGVIADAEKLASEIVSRMKRGRIKRDPLEQTCPKWCEFAPICRRERARPEPEDDDDEDEEHL